MAKSKLGLMKEFSEDSTQEVHKIDTSEEHEVHKTSTTNARKKKKRINMGFTDANYDFIVNKSESIGISITEYVNRIIANERESEQ